MNGPDNAATTIAPPPAGGPRDTLPGGRDGSPNEGFARRRDGTVVEAELNASPIMGPDGKMSGAALTILDITERQRTQRLLDRIVEHSPAVITVKDLDGRYRLFNRAGRRA